MGMFIGADPYGRRHLSPRKSTILYLADGRFGYALNERVGGRTLSATCTSIRHRLPSAFGSGATLLFWWAAAAGADAARRMDRGLPVVVFLIVNCGQTGGRPG